MANRGLSMLMIKQIIRRHCEGKSYREISSLLGQSRVTVTKYVLLFKSTGLVWDSVKNMSESELSVLFARQGRPNADRLSILHAEFPIMEQELKRVGVTKQTLWSEYKIKNPDGYNRSQFCEHFNQWSKAGAATMHFVHKVGDQMFVDFAGSKLRYLSSISGVVNEVEVFVAVLGASQLTYVEAVRSQKKADFIYAVENALHYFGGVPAAIVPDNLKSGVTKASSYEAQINETFAEFGEHYATTILPTRSRKPRDKSLVELSVKQIYTSIYAPLRDKIFFTLEDLNRAILEKLEDHNNRNFQKHDYSRRDYFTQHEASALKSLPLEKFEVKEFCKTKIQKFYHIWFSPDKHYYSVPFRYIGRDVKIVYTNTYVEIYCDLERIAHHTRTLGEHQYTTIADHMPSNHKFVSDWNCDYFLKWASRIGIDVENVIRNVLASKPHPEQTFKSCVGILSYEKKIGKERLNQVCKRAHNFGSYSYRSIKNIIEMNYDKLPNIEGAGNILPMHENIRGSNYYGNIS